MVALGVVALVGWAVGVRALTELFAGSSSLKANTALCFAALRREWGEMRRKGFHTAPEAPLPPV